jgi:outer membrane protein TolC
VLSARLRQDSQELNERVAKKNTRHQLDLVLTAATTRNNQESAFQYYDQTGTLTGSSSNLYDLKGEPIWTAAIQYSYPIANRAAKANYATALANREQADLALESTEQNIRVDVRAAARAVESGAKRVAAAKANTELQQKNVDAETKKFENGMSTSFEVLNVQTDLTNAQLAEIQALLDYNKALVDLERAKGTLLEAKGLKLDDSAGR